jgi:ABC-2 type transport system permease protein
MRHFFVVLWAGIKAYIIGAFQYRVQEGMQLIGLLVESLIYLIVWTTVAREQGGEVGGFTVGEFAGYFIAWMFVRNITTGWSPWAMEWQIRRGDFNSLLLRPIHPIVTATSDMLASKTVAMITVVPTMIGLALIFRPDFELIPWSLLALIPALVLAFMLRYTLMYVLALTAFWTTRVTALFELWFAAEFFFSGRIAPLSVLPEWGQQVAGYLPFQWMFYFPLELLLGRSTPQEAASGFLFQAAWLIVTIVLLRVVWRGAVRQYAAVGG